MSSPQATRALMLSGMVIGVGPEPDDVRGRTVNVVMLRQSSPGSGRTLKVPLTVNDESILKGLKQGHRITATCHLGTGNSSHIGVEIDSLERIPDGEEMELVNAGSIVGIRESCQFKAFPNKNGGMCDLTLLVDDRKVCLKVYGKLVDEAEESDDGDTLEVHYRVATRPDGDGIVATAVAVAIEVVS